jgi:hypothetical protein
VLAIDGHFETWPIRSSEFRGWLQKQYFTEHSTVPSSRALSSAIDLLEARAWFDSPQSRVHVRVGTYLGKYCLDLGDADWRAVEIDARGWRIQDTTLPQFLRREGMLSLPEPARAGSIELLKRYLNVSDAEFVLIVSWLLAALRDRGPFPILAVFGEAGSAKSTLLKFVRSLVDPNVAPARSPPSSDRDVFIAASNAWVVAFDNLSRVPEWLSDTLARLATGGGFGTRRLFADDKEQLFDATRPIMLGSIENVVDRGDLADRSIFIKLKPISDIERRSERQLSRDFERDRPLILGALLDGVAHGRRMLPTTQLACRPRMADFAEWAVACEGAFWSSGTFTSAYNQNRAAAIRCP